jgi:hypothetical protein
MLHLPMSLCPCFEFQLLIGYKESGHRETPSFTVTDTIDIPEALVIDYLAFVVTSSNIIA